MQKQPSVIRLKELLFEQEKSDIEALSRRLDAVGERASDDERLRESVARVLHLSAQDAEAKHHREFSDAIAPMVRRTFRAELRNETVQAQLASALYPKMGDMIRRYVASQMRDMMAKLNRRIERVLPKQNRTWLRLKSLFTGRSMAELALAEAPDFSVEELFLIHRNSGELVHHWTKGVDGAVERADRNNRDTLVSGFLSAITSFSEEAFAGERSSLRSIDLDDHRIYIRPSPSYLLAAKCSGTAAPAIEDSLDRSLIDILAKHQEVEARNPQDAGAEARRAAREQHEQILRDASESLEENVSAAAAGVRTAGQFRTLKALATLVGLTIVGLLGWHAYQSWITARVQGAVDDAIARVPELQGYPVAAFVCRGGEAMQLTGITPSLTVRNRLTDAVATATPGVKIDTRLAILPSTDLSGAVEGALTRRATEHASRRLKAIEAELAASVATLERGSGQEAIDRGRREIATAAIAVERVGQGFAGDPVQSIAVVEASRRRLQEALAAISTAPRREAPAAPATTPADAIDGLLLQAERLATAAALLSQQQTLTEAGVRQMAPLAEQNQALTREIATLAARIEALKRTPTPRERLAEFIRDHAIFFSNATDFRDPAASARTLDELAALLQATDVHLRLVGYTDEAGTPAANMSLSQARADRIEQELAQRGVPRNRLMPVGRGTALELQPRSGASNANRRVEFETSFKDERASPP